MKTFIQYISEGKTTKRQSGREFFRKLYLHPTREIQKMSPEAQTKFADRIRAASRQQSITASVNPVGTSVNEYLKHGQVKEPNYRDRDSMFSHEQEFRDFPKKYDAKRMKSLGVSIEDFKKTKKKLKNIHSRMKDNYGSDFESDSLRNQTAQEKGYSPTLEPE